MKDQECLDRLKQLFPKIKSIYKASTKRIYTGCPICEKPSKLSLDTSLDSVKCYICGFRANPIALFLDAYSFEPTGDLLEEDAPFVTVLNRRIEK